jgi:CTP-dependent riboflavin kinase
MKKWTFITNHGLVLLYISKNPQCTMRDMAAALGITERSIQRLLIDLEAEGYITRQSTGKGNIYNIKSKLGLKHDLTKNVVVGDLLELLSREKRKGRS